ncbi:HD domain-containing phosphohydrolase [Thalassobaculum sp. OXR-137]|uniref:HD domain-containing phosphohydrolase n=1 Tax=Thalassobaculum sp. OXR-137 TaxID=3100173 RepID=UPI002AC8D988|nr:HD domain-containing phosphohydrolase [Thalassobaculum sp. OXR-137]WPZ33006.1 HD domain-containing phosphohydrolase [Thalassobaculum sp. OXR-137]
MAIATDSDESASPRILDTLKGPAAAVSAAYVAVATLYILFSDLIVSLISSDPEVLIELQMTKGFAFVAVTGVSLFLVWTSLEKRERHERLRHENTRKRLGDLSNALPNPLLILDTDGRLVEWNAANEAVLGYSHSNLSGMTVDALAHPDDLAAAKAAIGRVKDTARPTNADVRLVTADGRTLSYRWHGAPLLDANGAVSEIAVVGIDMTDLKDAQERLRGALQGVKHVLKQTVDAIAMAVEKRDPYTAGHERRVAVLSLEIAHEMGLSNDACEGLEYSALLHDVGKLAVPTDILTRPGRLTASEFDVVKSHAEHGYEILREIDFPWPVADIIRQHHERLDGSGYPQGLKADEICREARIIGVADVVEAMWSHRPYRAGLGIDAALDELRAGSGTRYDPDVVRACETVIARGFAFAPAVA